MECLFSPHSKPGYFQWKNVYFFADALVSKSSSWYFWKIWKNSNRKQAFLSLLYSSQSISRNFQWSFDVRFSYLSRNYVQDNSSGSLIACDREIVAIVVVFSYDFANFYQLYLGLFSFAKRCFQHGRHSTSTGTAREFSVFLRKLCWRKPTAISWWILVFFLHSLSFFRLNWRFKG